MVKMKLHQIQQVKMFFSYCFKEFFRKKKAFVELLTVIKLNRGGSCNT